MSSEGISDIYSSAGSYDVQKETKAKTPQDQKINEAVQESLQSTSDSKGAELPQRPSVSPSLTSQLANQKAQLHRLIGIGISEDKLDSQVFLEKQAFLDRHLPTETATLIYQQSQESSIMLDAVKALDRNFAAWTPESQATLNVQLDNLNKLATVLKDIDLTSLESPNKDERNALQEFIQGKPLTEGDLTRIQTLLKDLQKPDQAKSKRKPIPPAIIQAEIKLATVKKEALDLLSQKTDLPFVEQEIARKARGEDRISVNEVSFIKRPARPERLEQRMQIRKKDGEVVEMVKPGKAAKPEQVIAVYKQGEGGFEAAGIMEELMWEVGKITGDATLLTATTLTPVFLKGSPKPDRHPKTRASSTPSSPIIRGGMQPFLKGSMTVKAWRTAPDPKPALQRSSVLQLVHFACLTGQEDLHHSNIMVMPDGSLKLMDNTRSLVHSNHAVFHLNHLRLPARLGLYGEAEMESPLSIDEREQFKQKIVEDREKVKQIADLFNRPEIKAKLGTLPPGWFDSDKVLKAMEERINLMEAALNNPHVVTLSDFMLYSMPTIKLAVGCISLIKHKSALMQLAKGDPSAYLKAKAEILANAGFDHFDDLFSNSAKAGYDPAMVCEIALDPDISFDQFIQKLAAMAEKPGNPRVCKLQAQRLRWELLETASVDSKDMDPTESSENIASYDFDKKVLKITLAGEFKNDILKNNFEVVTESEHVLEEFEHEIYPACWAILDKDKNYKLYFQDETGIIHQAKVDYLTTIFSVEGIDLPYGSTVKDIKARLVPPYFLQLKSDAEDNKNAVEKIVKAAPGSWAMSKDNEGEYLLIHCNDGKQYYTIALKPQDPVPGQPLKYKMYNRNGSREILTLAQIAEKTTASGMQALTEGDVKTAKTLKPLLGKLTALYSCPSQPDNSASRDILQQRASPYYCILYDKAFPPNATFYYKTISGKIKNAPIDYRSKPGEALINGRPIKEFIDSVSLPNCYPNITEFDQAYDLLEKDDKGWLLGFDPDDHHLVLYYNNKGGIDGDPLTINPDNPEEFLMEEINNPDDSQILMTLLGLLTYMESLGFHPHNR